MQEKSASQSRTSGRKIWGFWSDFLAHQKKAQPLSPQIFTL